VYCCWFLCRLTKHKFTSKDIKLNELKTQSIGCTQKDVQVYKFCIRGDPDLGSISEHKIRFDGQHYFPNRPGDCVESSPGYCDVQEGSCHMLNNAPWVPIENFQSLTVGTERQVGFGLGDEATFVHIPASEWNTASCEPYEIVMARDFKSEQDKNICWNVGLSFPIQIGGPIPIEYVKLKSGLEWSGLECNSDGGVTSGGVDIGVDCCHKWTEPAESYTWFMKVSPKVYDYESIRSAVIRNYCMHVPDYNTHNGNELVVHQCDGESNQLFALDEYGYMRSRINPEKCLDATGPATVNGTPVQIWDCMNDYPSQKWEMTESKQIRLQSKPNQCMGIPETMNNDFMGMSMSRTVFNGNAIMLFDCGEDTNQQWFF